MEFWGVEVKAGESVTVSPGKQVIHISQVALGKANDSTRAGYVAAQLKMDGKEFVIGTLSGKRIPQMACDLVCGKNFELSHDWKDGSLYFCGYSAELEDKGQSDSDESSSDEESWSEEDYNYVKRVSISKANPKSSTKTHVESSDSDEDSSSEEEDKNGTPVPDDQVKNPTKSKAKIPDSSSDSSDESDSDSSSDSDDSSSEDEQAPKKAEASKKRPFESATKTPVPDKKKIKNGDVIAKEN